MANVNILVGEKVKLSIVPTLSKESADIIGTPTWSAADPTVVYLDPAEDGRTCVVTGKKAGSSAVTASALGSTTITASHTIVVAANNLADTLDLTVDPYP